MSLAEGVSARVTYKAYASATITANTLATSSSALAVSGGQILRRVASTLNLVKDTYQAAEVASHRQIVDFRHGVKRVTGSITGELSPGTYWDFMEAVCRGTESAAVVTASQSDFTSVSADNTTSKFTFTAGNPHSKGYRVGDVLQFTNLSDSDNNAKNFVVTSMGGTSTREVSVYPAPDTMTADNAFTMTTVGKSVYAPASGHVSRKYGIEVYHSDIDFHRLFTECRCGGFNFGLPATGMATVEIPFMGRDMETASSGSSPFFTAPAAETTTGITAAVNGLVQVAGTTVGVVTGATINITLNPTSDAVVGQNFVPEIFLGRMNVSGQATVLLQDVTFIDYFKNETEVSMLFYLTTSSSATADAITITLPRVKFGDASVGVQGEQGQIITMPFVALKYATAGSGFEATTVRFTDTQAS